MAVDVATHPPEGFMNTYTAPLLREASLWALSLPSAPTAILPPSALTDTDLPNKSPADASDAVSFADTADAAHPVAGLVNTYAAPLSPPRPAPSTIVLPSPLTDTDSPNQSPSAPSDAVSLADEADAVHPVAGLVNT